MPPVLGGMGRINDIDSNDTSRYHPPPTTSIIKSLSVNQLSPSVPQFLSFVLGGILDKDVTMSVHYTEDFKKEVVKAYMAGDKSIQQLAVDFNVAKSSVSK